LKTAWSVLVSSAYHDYDSSQTQIGTVLGRLRGAQGRLEEGKRGECSFPLEGIRTGEKKSVFTMDTSEATTCGAWPETQGEEQPNFNKARSEGPGFAASSVEIVIGLTCAPSCWSSAGMGGEL